jgi:hypothetical protein
MTLTNDVTASSISNGSTGQAITLVLCQDSTGGRSMVWPGNLKLAGGTFTLTTAASQCDTLTATFDGSVWRETSRAINE